MSRVSTLEQMMMAAQPKRKFDFDRLSVIPIACLFSTADIDELIQIATSIRYNANIHKECARDSPVDHTATCLCKVLKAEAMGKIQILPSTNGLPLEPITSKHGSETGNETLNMLARYLIRTVNR